MSRFTDEPIEDPRPETDTSCGWCGCDGGEPCDRGCPRVVGPLAQHLVTEWGDVVVRLVFTRPTPSFEYGDKWTGVLFPDAGNAAILKNGRVVASGEWKDDRIDGVSDGRVVELGPFPGEDGHRLELVEAALTYWAASGVAPRRQS